MLVGLYVGGCRVLGLMMVVGGLLLIGLVLIGVVLIGVVWVLLVGCLLFYEVGVWLGTGWYGYVGIHDRPMETKLNSNAKCLKPDAIKLI